MTPFDAMTTVVQKQETATALWIIRPSQAELRAAPLGPRPGESLTVEAQYGAISRGTEALVFNGQVPESEYARMRCPLQEGEFPGPVKYGYMTVGRVIDGPAEWLNKTVFALAPHQDRFHVPAGMVATVPEGVPAQRAVLAANMETALNATWDAGLLPGMNVVVVGAGVAGALVGALAALTPGCAVTLVDTNPDRSDLAATLGCAFAAPDMAPADADLVVHATASEAGLATALTAAGDEATVLELSWYGTNTPAVPLGAAFHARRLALKSSQVGQVAPAMRPRWSHARRLSKALELLRDDRFDVLFTGTCRFADLPQTLARLARDPAGALCQRIVYPAAETEGEA